MNNAPNQIDDDPTTLTYLNATSVDPLNATTGTPYLYANANPTTLSDRSGLSPADACAASGGTGACLRAFVDEVASLPIAVPAAGSKDGVAITQEMVRFQDVVTGYLDMAANQSVDWSRLGIDWLTTEQRLAVSFVRGLWLTGQVDVAGSGFVARDGHDLEFRARYYLDPDVSAGARFDMWRCEPRGCEEGQFSWHQVSLVTGAVSNAASLVAAGCFTLTFATGGLSLACGGPAAAVALVLGGVSVGAGALAGDDVRCTGGSFAVSVILPGPSDDIAVRVASSMGLTREAFGLTTSVAC